MKLQPAAKKEIFHIAVGTGLCTVVMLAVFGVLALNGLFRFDYTVVLGAVLGAVVAVGNFAAMCMTVQAATGESDPARSRARIQMSYNFRMLAQALWCVVAFAAAWIQPIAGMVPLLFPRLVIYYLEITGRKKQKQEAAAAKTDPAADADEQER